MIEQDLAAFGADSYPEVAAVLEQRRARAHLSVVRSSTAATLRLCIDRCARAKDGRGPWQAELACATKLAEIGSTAIAFDCAAAARRIGEWLRER